MANGNHAPLMVLEPELPPLDPTVPGVDRSRLEAIGEAAAEAAIALSVSMLAFHETGRLAASLKEAGAEKIAKLATLELDSFGEINFNKIAHREGLIRLRRSLDAEFFQKHGANAGDRILTGILAGVLEIVSRVVAVERALRAN